MSVISLEADSALHEKRAHVRVTLPGHILIDEAWFDLVDWSVTGARIAVEHMEDVAHFREGDVRQAMLYFALDAFEVTVPLTVCFKNISGDSNYIGMCFTQVSERQNAVLWQLVSAYVEGALVDVGDMIRVVQEVQEPRPVPAPPPASAVMKLPYSFGFICGMVAAVLASCMLLYYAFTSLYERRNTVEMSGAYVSVAHQVVRAPASGVIHFSYHQEGVRVQRGQSLGVMAADGVLPFHLRSPCDCTISHFVVPNATAVSAGEALLHVSPENASLLIEGDVAAEDAARIHDGHLAYIALQDHDEWFEGEVVALSDTLGDDALRSTSRRRIQVQPRDDIPAYWLDERAQVRLEVSARAQ